MRLLLALLLLLTTTAPSLAQGETRRFFRDWLAACRPDGYCSATAYDNPGANGTVADYILRIGRHAEQPYWEISFATVAAMGDEWQDFVVTVDGVSETFSLHDQVGAYGSINDFFLLGEGAQAVMDRLAPGTAMSIAFTDTDGNAQQTRFSLSGLTAALIWIDEQQGRLGSERVASAPPWGEVPVGSGQPATPEVPTALLDRHRGDPDCQPLEDLANGRDIVAAPLDESSTLYMLPCAAGAYNFAQKVYVETLGEFYPQYFADYSAASGWIGTPFLINAGFDPETGTLMSFNKSRGIGDCGSMGTWRWIGHIFRLEEFRSRDCSDEVPEPEGEMPEFPVVFTAEPLPKEPA